MNRFFLALLTFLLVLLYAFPALALEGDVTPEPSQEPLTAETQVDGKNIVVNVTLPAVTPSPMPSELPTESPVVDAATYSPYSTFALDAGSGGTPNTLAETVTALFGEYTPRTQTVTEHLADGTSVTYTQVVPGVAGLDYHWLASVGLFALVLFGFLRLLGGLLKL